MAGGPPETAGVSYRLTDDKVCFGGRVSTSRRNVEEVCNQYMNRKLSTEKHDETNGQTNRWFKRYIRLTSAKIMQLEIVNR